MSKLTTKPLKDVEQKTWDSWTNYWISKEFQKKSNIGKKNRNRNGKEMVNHTGGSQTFEVHLKRLWMKNIYPDPTEFHRLTHIWKNKPGIFCDDHASQVNADYSLKKREALLQVQSEAEASASSMPNDLVPEKKAALFKEAAEGGKRWGIWFGIDSVEVLPFREKKFFVIDVWFVKCQ